MPIARLTAHHVRIPLKRTIRHASHARNETDSIIVRCELSDGSVGWGEGLPRDYVTGETIDEAWELLQTSDVAEQLSETFDDVPLAIERLDRLTLCGAEASDLKFAIAADRREQVEAYVRRGCFGNSVRCAIELAVLDAVCSREGMPLSHVTGLVAGTQGIRQRVDEVHYSGIITGDGSWSRLRAALKQRLYGFRQIKVKVGVAGQDDATVLRQIRRVVGPDVDLRIDANEAWTCGALTDKLEPLTRVNVSCVEQPVPHAEAAGLADARAATDVPIMLDESLCSLADARRAIDGGLCDLFNIRLSKCGGLLPSLRLAATAHAAGLGCQLGCQVGETGILSAAGRHFATSAAGMRYLEGSYDRHLVRERLTAQDVTFGYGGRAPAITGPGLGVTVDPEAVRRVTQRRIELM